MEHYVKLIYDKLEYVNQHEGDGAIIHEAGHLAGLIFNYNHLIERETTNPIMPPEYLIWYTDQLKKYTLEGERFLEKISNSMVTMV